MNRLIPHIILLRQIQYLFPEFFYKTSYYEHLKHFSLYVFVIFVFVGYFYKQERTKSLNWLIITAIILEALRAFDYVFILNDIDFNIFNLALVVGIIGGSIYQIIRKWK